MKTSKISCITLLCGLCLAITVAWFGVSVTDGAENGYGAWIEIGESTPCRGETGDDCENNSSWGCDQEAVVICKVDYQCPDGECDFAGNPCTGGLPGYDCTELHDTDCK